MYVPNLVNNRGSPSRRRQARVLRSCRTNHRVHLRSPGMACVSYFQASSKEPSFHGCFYVESLAVEVTTNYPEPRRM